MQNNEAETNLIKTTIKLLGLFQKLERSKLTINRIKNKKDMGLVYNHTPYGYKRVKNKLIKDNKEQKIISYIKDQHKKNMSYRSIARNLNENRVPTKLGKKWYANTVKRMVIMKE